MKPFLAFCLCFAIFASCDSPFEMVDGEVPEYYIEKLSGDTQLGYVNRVLEDSLVFSVNRGSTPLENELVSITQVNGNGQIDGISVGQKLPTDDLGRIFLVWQLDGTEGLQTIYLQFSYKLDDNQSVSMDVQFTATAELYCPSQIKIDGEYYPTVEINGKINENTSDEKEVFQCWMARNLNRGNMIPSSKIADSTDIEIEKYCFQDLEINCEIYGGLYIWQELLYNSIDNQGICPEGWVIPTDDDWKTLEKLMGMSGVEADSQDITNYRGKLVAAGTALQVGGSSGFNALLGGFLSRGFQCDSSSAINYCELGQLGVYWTSTESNEEARRAYKRDFKFNEPGVLRYYMPERVAASVRCLKL